MSTTPTRQKKRVFAMGKKHKQRKKNEEKKKKWHRKKKKNESLDRREVESVEIPLLVYVMNLSSKPIAMFTGGCHTEKKTMRPFV